jgi:hypothetical protein
VSPLTDDAYDALKRAAVAAGVVPADRVVREREGERVR